MRVITDVREEAPQGVLYVNDIVVCDETEQEEEVKFRKMKRREKKNENNISYIISSQQQKTNGEPGEDVAIKLIGRD